MFRHHTPTGHQQQQHMTDMKPGTADDNGTDDKEYAGGGEIAVWQQLNEHLRQNNEILREHARGLALDVAVAEQIQRMKDKVGRPEELRAAIVRALALCATKGGWVNAYENNNDQNKEDGVGAETNPDFATDPSASQLLRWLAGPTICVRFWLEKHLNNMGADDTKTKSERLVIELISLMQAAFHDRAFPRALSDFPWATFSGLEAADNATTLRPILADVSSGGASGGGDHGTMHNQLVELTNKLSKRLLAVAFVEAADNLALQQHERGLASSASSACNNSARAHASPALSTATVPVGLVATCLVTRFGSTDNCGLDELRRILKLDAHGFERETVQAVHAEWQLALHLRARQLLGECGSATRTTFPLSVEGGMLTPEQTFWTLEDMKACSGIAVRGVCAPGSTSIVPPLHPLHFRISLVFDVDRQKPEKPLVPHQQQHVVVDSSADPITVVPKEIRLERQPPFAGEEQAARREEDKKKDKKKDKKEDKKKDKKKDKKEDKKKDKKDKKKRKKPSTSSSTKRATAAAVCVPFAPEHAPRPGPNANIFVSGFSIARFSVLVVPPDRMSLLTVGAFVGLDDPRNRRLVVVRDPTRLADLFRKWSANPHTRGATTGLTADDFKVMAMPSTHVLRIAPLCRVAEATGMSMADLAKILSGSPPADARQGLVDAPDYPESGVWATGCDFLRVMRDDAALVGVGGPSDQGTCLFCCPTRDLLSALTDPVSSKTSDGDKVTKRARSAAGATI